MVYGKWPIGLVVLIVWFNSRRLRARAIELAEEVRKATKVIREQKEEAEKQKDAVEEKNKDITDSIRYAQSIQEAILPDVALINNHIPEMFILFKPRDIVSGDFYFFSEVGGNLILAACDCTGHGVPGAFMSMIGSQLLSETVTDKHVMRAGTVLDRLKEGIISALGQTGITGETRDGMDMALCMFDSKLSTVQFAGANNPLWIVRNNGRPLSGDKIKVYSLDENDSQTALYAVQPDKQPIGYEEGKEGPFTTHDISLQKGDTIYMFSDGYADQYGGDYDSLYGKGKKFNKRRFRELVLSLQQKSMTEQKEILDKTIEDWKGDIEQVDDIVVIGVRV